MAAILHKMEIGHCGSRAGDDSLRKYVKYYQLVLHKAFALLLQTIGLNGC